MNGFYTGGKAVVNHGQANKQRKREEVTDTSRPSCYSGQTLLCLAQVA